MGVLKYYDADTAQWVPIAQIAAAGPIGPSGGILRVVTNTTASLTAGSVINTDYVYLVAGAHTITLPTATDNKNRYTVKNKHTANITINTTAAQTIDGATSIQLAPSDSVDIISNNSNWSII